MLQCSRALFVASAAAAVALLIWRRRHRRTRAAAHVVDDHDCVRFRLDAQTGFLANVSSSRLPPPFDAWEDLAQRLAELQVQGQLQAKIIQLPTLRLADFDGAQLRRARVLLGALVHSYVHGARVPWRLLQPVGTEAMGRYVYRPEPASSPETTPPSLTSLPPQLAIPWCEVSDALGLPRILTATDTDLWNHVPLRRDITPRECLDEFAQLVSMTGTASERGFHAMPAAIQLELSPLLASMLAVPRLVEQADHLACEAVCGAIESRLIQVRALLSHVDDLVDMDEFYDVYRLLLGGWGSEGLVLHGVGSAEQAAVASHDGPSAGQTAILICVDLVLGTQHGPNLAQFQGGMRHYLPAPHRDLIERLDAGLRASGSLRTAAIAAGPRSSLASAHAAALHALAGMRAFHKGMATKYLRKALKGTGGSDFRALLDEGLRATRASKVEGV